MNFALKLFKRMLLLFLGRLKAEHRLRGERAWKIVGKNYLNSRRVHCFSINVVYSDEMQSNQLKSVGFSALRSEILFSREVAGYVG